MVNGKLRVVAIHRGSLPEKYLSYGSLFSAVLDHAFKSEGNSIAVYY